MAAFTHTHIYIYMYFLKFQSFDLQAHELGNALDAVNRLEESQEKCSTTCEALWQSSSDVLGLFHKKFIQVSDRAIQSGK